MNYGQTFREIRENKGYTLKEVSEGIVSVSFLSKFERGESEISIQNIHALLDRLKVTFEEFLFFHNNNQPSELEAFFNRAHEYYLKRDLQSLQKMHDEQMALWEKYKVKPYRCQAVILKIYENIISDKMIDEERDGLKELIDYLFNVEVWTLYELRLYSKTILVLDEKMIETLSKTAYKKSKQYQGLPKIRETVNNILLNTIIYLIGPVNQPKKLVNEQSIQYFFEMVEGNCLETDLLLKTNIIQLKGMYEVKKGNREAGLKMVDRAIEVFKDLQAPHLAKDAERYSNLMLKYR
ncbi:helix-turn-helix domain-containing protein [Alkalibacillus haloalkaliphilus]|uniref:helix-turn-helix domain-containing protein n=1 Tax=Alkalibacillus haloalkaliphilus TaxID=94136 RepID=UPI0029355615|nr:helix-turn-helix domain-containing protein [Alkalibacillus haloalkaliphilus]MDV2581727.1 helix-turn-helix domain-containing protein [Alkalibacillus haloalkaliphilus]